MSILILARKIVRRKIPSKRGGGDMKVLFLRTLTVAVGALLWAAPAVAGQQAGSDRAARINAEAAKPTPRLADGHPDLSGNWSDPPPPQVPANFVNLPMVKSGDGK